MRRYLIALSFALCTLTPGVARAALCPPTHTFTTGETLTSTILNSNPVTTSNCLANLDYTNVGTAGFYASNLKPANGTQATFGGTQTYTFPAAVTVNGGLSMTGALSGATSLTTSGALTAASGSFTGNLSVGGNQTITGGLTTTGLINNAPTNLNGNTTINGNETVTGTATAANVSSTGNVSFGNGTTGGTFYGSNGTASITGGYFSGVAGTQTISGALTYGVNQGGYTNAVIASNNGALANGISADTFGLFGSPSGTLLASIDHTGSMGLVNQLKVYNNIYTLNGVYQQNTSGTAFTLPYDANSTSGSTNTHYEHNTATTGTYSGGVACSGTIGFIKTFSTNPDIFFTIIPPATYTNAIPYISSRSTSNFVVCWNSTGAVSGTTSFSWFAVGE